MENTPTPELLDFISQLVIRQNKRDAKHLLRCQGVTAAAATYVKKWACERALN